MRKHHKTMIFKNDEFKNGYRLYYTASEEGFQKEFF